VDTQRPEIIMRLAILLLALSLTASAQVYKWTDENGRTVFGQRPPPTANSEHVEIGETNGALPPAEAYKSRPQSRSTARRSARDTSMCDYAKDRIRRLDARWEQVKSQGYTVADENSYKRQIKEARRYKDEQC